MAICPFAVKKLIEPGVNDPKIKAIGAVLHVDGGNVFSLYDFFDGPSGGIESHFHIRKDGVIEQYRDTVYEADANYKGNSFYVDGVRCGLISIETQGRAEGEWNELQMASIKRLLKWLSDVHDFPLRVCPDWNKSGVGYHVMFGAPGPWAPRAKVCPGKERIEQFWAVIVPWFDAADEPPVLPVEEDDEMDMVSYYGSGTGNLARLYKGDMAVGITKKMADKMVKAGAAKLVPFTNDENDLLTSRLRFEGDVVE